MTMHAKFNKDAKVSLIWSDKEDIAFLIDHEQPADNNELTSLSLEAELATENTSPDLKIILCSGKILSWQQVIRIILESRVAGN